MAVLNRYQNGGLSPRTNAASDTPTVGLVGPCIRGWARFRTTLSDSAIAPEGRTAIVSATIAAASVGERVPPSYGYPLSHPQVSKRHGSKGFAAAFDSTWPCACNPTP